MLSLVVNVGGVELTGMVVVGDTFSGGCMHRLGSTFDETIHRHTGMVYDLWGRW